jgi:hypothetical protein
MPPATKTPGTLVALEGLGHDRGSAAGRDVGPPSGLSVVNGRTTYVADVLATCSSATQLWLGDGGHGWAIRS